MPPAKSPRTTVPALLRKLWWTPGFHTTGPISSGRRVTFWKILRKTFRAAGTDLENVVKAQVFLTDLGDFFYFDQVWKEFFPSPPPRTTVGTTGLLVPGCKVEIDLIAVKG